MDPAGLFCYLKGNGKEAMLRYLPTIELTEKEDAARLQEAARLSAALSVSLRTARLLIDRGIRDEAAARAFLHPSESMLHDPFLFRDMEKAVRRIRRAIRDREHIFIFGDYDADGVSATSMLLLYLRGEGANVDYHIPSRHTEGYGMSIGAVERLKERGAELIITVDNGVKANRELALCRELNMDVIVTDHHLPGDELPPCEALLCHTVEGCTYPNKNICGAGTAFKLIEALGGREAAMRYISLAAIATAADVVPLVGENRVFAALGLRAINKGDCPIGLSALQDVAMEKKRTLTSRDLVFVIAPRLNAAGRMEDASLSVALLTETEKGRALQLAERLDQLNQARQREEGAVYEDAVKAIEADDLTDKRTIVLKSPDWNSGVVGIAASKLAERYHRPVVLLSEHEGILTGSARSVEGVDLHAALKENERFFIRFGGHAYAAGMTLPLENYEPFCKAFDTSVRNAVCEELFRPAAHYEEAVSFGELTMQLAAEIALLAPFGEGNPTPVFRTDGANVKRLQRIGESGKHLRLSFEGDGHYEEAVWFYAGDRFDEINDYGRADILYVPSVNEFNGRRSLQLEMRAIRPASAPDAEAYILARRKKFIDAFSCNIRYNNMNAMCDHALADPDAFLKKTLEEGIAGTLVLCFTPAGAVRFLRFAEKENLFAKMEIGFEKNLRQPCAYHAAVFAPVIDALTVSRFRHVIVYDTPVSLGISDALCALAPKARIVLAKPVETDMASHFQSLYFDRACLVPFYKALVRRGGSYYNRTVLLDHFARETQAPSHICMLAADICIELGFLEKGEGEQLCFAAAKEKRDLSESPTFRTAASLEAMHGHANRILNSRWAELQTQNREEGQP